MCFFTSWLYFSSFSINSLLLSMDGPETALTVIDDADNALCLLKVIIKTVQLLSSLEDT